MMRSLFLLSCVLLACTNPEKRSTEHWFFDLEAYTTGERNRLQNGVAVDKSVTLDGKVENQHFDAYTWEAELEMLSQLDINKPAWKDLYTVDTLRTGDAEKYVYKADDEDLQVQKMIISQQANQIDSILIYTRVKNPLHTTTGTLLYCPDKSLSFSQISRRRFGDDKDLKVEVRRSVTVD
ncbi:MAG: hypothetical protein KA479_10080 [Saprospiraceae bacterium]|nr:hypothetical protein [Saprospiraceae bacterium]